LKTDNNSPGAASSWA